MYAEVTVNQGLLEGEDGKHAAARLAVHLLLSLTRDAYCAERTEFLISNRASIHARYFNGIVNKLAIVT